MTIMDFFKNFFQVWGPNLASLASYWTMIGRAKLPSLTIMAGETRGLFMVVAAIPRFIQGATKARDTSRGEFPQIIDVNYGN